MDKTMLSKHKYIHEVYIAAYNRIHLERYPVVYINGRYVYYSRGNQQMLGFLSLDSVHDSLESHLRNNINRGRHLNYGFDRLFAWEVGGDPNELRAKLQAMNDKEDKKSKSPWRNGVWRLPK